MITSGWSRSERGRLYKSTPRACAGGDCGLPLDPLRMEQALALGVGCDWRLAGASSKCRKRWSRGVMELRRENLVGDGG